MRYLEEQERLEAATRLGVHDASRIEWVVEFPLPRQRTEELEIEFSAEVPARVWAEHDHWEHLQLFARLSSPDEELGGEAPEALTVDALRRSTLAAVHRFKTAGDELQREIFLAASLFSASPRATLEQEIREGLADALAALDASRSQLLERRPKEAPELSRERILAAEFLSNHALDLLSNIQQAIDEQLCGPRSRHRVAFLEVAAAIRPVLAEAMSEELRFRAYHDFMEPDPSDAWQLERFVSRASLLKKHFQEVLFLDLETARIEKRYRSWYAVVAALFAGIWAYPLRYLVTGDSGMAGVGFSLGTSLTLLVMMYAIRDHIKETVRTWLTARIAGFAGRLGNLTLPSQLLGESVRLARVRESFVAERTKRLDSLHPDLGGGREMIRLRYSMRGAVQGDPRLIHEGLDKAKLVFRYDLSPLFARLDDPIKRVPILAEDGRSLVFAEAARCYRIPVRLTVRHQGQLIQETGDLIAHKLGLERFERPFASVDRAQAVPGAPPIAAISWGAMRRR